MYTSDWHDPPVAQPRPKKGREYIPGPFCFDGRMLLLLRRPDHSLLLLGHRLEPGVHEFLYPFAFVRLGGVDVALGISGDAVDREPLARLAATVAKLRQDLQRLAVDHVDM